MEVRKTKCERHEEYKLRTTNRNSILNSTSSRSTTTTENEYFWNRGCLYGGLLGQGKEVILFKVNLNSKPVNKHFYFACHTILKVKSEIYINDYSYECGKSKNLQELCEKRIKQYKT